MKKVALLFDGERFQKYADAQKFSCAKQRCEDCDPYERAVCGTFAQFVEHIPSSPYWSKLCKLAPKRVKKWTKWLRRTCEKKKWVISSTMDFEELSDYVGQCMMGEMKSNIPHCFSVAPTTQCKTCAIKKVCHRYMAYVAVTRGTYDEQGSNPLQIQKKASK